uniref:serine/threonine-protein kinase Nek10 n=1 Tax=Ciona intestinalis TaxID=7719 RepID=UPI00089DCF4C|nr:serine/threonine-protein kinase Nek10 [Ciona intestinalis]|eukprot:XP_018673190.1 serine/threonine-protein kinase Nek10 [Ciona intestinalis]
MTNFLSSDEAINLNEIIKLLSEKTKQNDRTQLETRCKRLCELLEWFSEHFKHDRKFSLHAHKELFKKLFSVIVKQKVPVISSNEEIKLNIVICLRMLMRDPYFQQAFIRSDGITYFSDMFHVKAKNYLVCAEETCVVDLTAHLASMFYKLSNHPKNHDILIDISIHKTMLHLLKAGDVFILHCALHTLTALAENKTLRTLIGDLHSVEQVIQIIQEFDDYSKCCGADLLRTLSSDAEIQQQMMIYDALPVLLSVLNDCEQCDLLWHVVWILVQLCSDVEWANEIRLLGGVPVLLNLLNSNRTLNCGRFKLSSGYVRHTRAAVTPLTSNKDELTESKIRLYSACCAALTELALDDRCTQTIVQSNGLYIIAKFILPRNLPEKSSNSGILLQQNAFRALRFLFSMERNRKMFKRLFPPDMFQSFIDIGHYVRESEEYKPLVEQLNSMEEQGLDDVRSGVEELNQNKTPKRRIREYDIYDILGSGAFGSVYRVRKGSNQTTLALKEVRMVTGGGKKGKERQKREIDEIVRELSIIREQLRHPNVVRYYSTFQENDKLYIEMELIEGASLQDYFNSLKEKKEPGMGEIRLWRVFIQMCLALRYLHCDKRIVHRDLSPNNVMLGENDKVTITDFGLAKQKPDSSKMMSVVGTILYSCPEIIKNEPYNEKADIWALGCILYQMATLDPPFLTSNMLSLAKNICDGEFPPIPDDGTYTKLVNKTVSCCLTVEPSERPDIIGVCGVISGPLMRYTDHITHLHMVAEKRVEKERRRTQRHFYEARRNRQDYQTLFQASQGSYERASRNFDGSNGSVTSQSSDIPTTMRSNSDETEVFDADNATEDKGIEIKVDSSMARNFVNGHDKVETPLRKPTRPVSAGTKQPHPPSPDLRGEVPRRALSFDLSARSNSNELRAPPSGRSLMNSRGRPASSCGGTSRMLSISPSKLRQINDPVQQTLIQLHKIIYIDQLPPTSEVNFRRRIISRYKRSLFSPNSPSAGLKNELKKLLCGSHETIDVGFLEATSLAQRATAEAETRELLGDQSTTTVTAEPSSLYEGGITYGQMQGIIERVLKESGYYDITNRDNRLLCKNI